MPVLSERKVLFRQFNALLIQLVIDGRDSTKEFSKIIEFAASLSSCRYLNPRNPIPNFLEWRELFFSFPEGEFRQMVRMDQISFLQILQKIEDHPVFITIL